MDVHRCSSCSDAEVAGQTCPACGARPDAQDGVATAADGEHDDGGYDAEIFAQLAPLEAESFWFRSRNELIQESLADAFRDGAPARSFLEIGCGTGFVLAGIEDRFPDLALTGSEIFPEGLAFARTRLPRAELVQLDARALPYSEAFSAIGAFDVLEHIEEDRDVLAEVFRTLEPGGTLVVSVPQHRWLWSPADDYAHHVRRYTGPELRAKVTAAGFRVVQDTSFVTLLLPLMVVSRLLGRLLRRPYDPRAEMQVSPALNASLTKVMTFERWLVRRGVRLPVGGSRLVVARKPW